MKHIFIFLFLAGELTKCVLLLIPQYLLHHIASKSCLKAHVENSLTFLPIKDVNNKGKVLYFHSNTEAWFEKVKNQYNAIYRVVPTPDLRPEDSTDLCFGQTSCPFFRTRTNVDPFVWLFLYYGYLCMIQFITSLLYNGLQLKHLYETRDFTGILELTNGAEVEDKGEGRLEINENARCSDDTDTSGVPGLREQLQESSGVNASLSEWLAKNAIPIPYMQDANLREQLESNLRANT